MSTVLTIYVDDMTEARLRTSARRHNRSPEDLAASAVENYMADVYSRKRRQPEGEQDGSIPERHPPPEWG